MHIMTDAVERTELTHHSECSQETEDVEMSSTLKQLIRAEIRKEVTDCIMMEMKPGGLLHHGRW